MDTIDGKVLVGKEFTYKGKQIMVVDYSSGNGTISIARVVRGKPEPKWIKVRVKDFSRMVGRKIESLQSESKKPCLCPQYPSNCDEKCPRHCGLIPFLGRGEDGKSAGEITTGEPTAPGPSMECAGQLFTAEQIEEDIEMFANLAEAKEVDVGVVALRLAKKYLIPGVLFKIKNKNIRGGYISGFAVGDDLGIERKVLPARGEVLGNFLQKQVNISAPAQRNQSAVKVKDLLKDVADGTLLVNNSKKDTAEFKKWANTLIQGIS